MASFIATRTVQATPMNRQKYNDLRGWQVPDNENPDDDGYLVVNSSVSERNVDGFDGYVSWLPKLAFDEQYKPNKDGLFYFAINDDNGVYIGEADTVEQAKENALKIKETHTLVDEFDFGMALHLLKAGQKVARKGWNGKGMYLLLINGEAVRHSINQAYGDSYPDSLGLPVLDAIYMKTADNKLVAWLASQTDVLADDWTLID